MAQGILDIPSGGGSSGWQRPSEWPDISKLDRTGEVVYLLYSADEETGFCDILAQATYNVTIGHIESNAFVADESEKVVASNSRFRKYFGSPNGGYKVIRITSSSGDALFKVATSGTYQQLVDGHPLFGQAQGLLEVYGNASNLKFSLEFDAMKYLQSVDVTNIRPEKISFSSCFSLQNINTSTWNTLNITSFQNCFQSCYALRYVDTKSLVTSNCTTVQNMFQNCTSLENIDVSEWDTSNVTSFSGLFNACRSLEKLSLPNGFVTSKATSISSMFQNCSQLSDINLTGWNTSNVTTVSSLFNSSSIKKGDISMLDLSSVTNANNTQYIFQNVVTAPSITMPSTLAVLNSSAFSGSQIYEFHFLSTTPPTLSNTNNFPNMTNYGGRKIYVPYSADHSVLNAYKTATNWSTFANYIFEESQ